MIEEKDLLTFKSPSKKRIAAAAAVALLIAAVLLVTAVLPAEYGIDPLGTGAALRLTDLAGASKTPVVGASAETAATIAPVLEPSPDGGAPLVKGAFIAQPKGYKI